MSFPLGTFPLLLECTSRTYEAFLYVQWTEKIYRPVSIETFSILFSPLRIQIGKVILSNLFTI